MWLSSRIALYVLSSSILNDRERWETSAEHSSTERWNEPIQECRRFENEICPAHHVMWNDKREREIICPCVPIWIISLEMRRSISHGQARVKLALLLQRAFRYSYREKCCGYCSTIHCELFFRLLLLFILLFVLYASSALTSDFAHNSTNTFPEFFNGRHCSHDLDQIDRSSKRCFRNSPTNLVFQPKNDQIVQLAGLAQKKLNESSCDWIRVWSEMPDGKRQRELLRNFTVIVDFSPAKNLKEERKLIYHILVRMPNVVVRNDPIDLSFLSYLHPSFIPDRETNDFTDLKIFLDLLLILYQSNQSMDYQLKRRAVTCTPFRLDLGDSQRCFNDFLRSRFDSL